MARFSIKSFALKWYFFNCPSSTILYAEYFSLFMKQLGFNPAQIGLTSLFGVLQLFLPLYLMFGERFRARKTSAFAGTLGLSVCCLLPLLAMIVPALQPTCYATPSINSTKATQAFQRHGSGHSGNINNSKHLSVSKGTLSDLRSTMTPILKNIFLYPTSKRSENTPHQSRSQVRYTIPYLTSNSSTHQLDKNNNSLAYSKYSKNLRHQTSSKFPKTLENLSLDNTMPTQPTLRDYSRDTQRQSAPKPRHLQYLTTNSSLNGSFLTNYSDNPTNPSNIHHPQSTLSALFLILTLSRSLTMFFDRADLALANLATITYLKDDRSSYGAYYLWTNIGCTFSISFVAVLAWFIKIYICENETAGYFTAFVCGGFMTLLSMVSLPWFKFEYNEKRSFNWSGVKSDVFNAHYIFILAVVFYNGLCLSFQVYWEFWYLDGLSASPLLLAGAVVIRRPLVALSTLASSYLIRKIG